MSSETIQIVRDGRVLVGATDLIYSVDDNGYYFHQTEFNKNRSRTSKKVYRSRDAAMSEWGRRAVGWEPWY